MKSPISANSMISSNRWSISRLGHAVQARREVDVVAHGEVVDEPAGDLDERGDPAVARRRVPSSGSITCGDQLEQRRLALAVAADDPDRLARLRP